MNINSTSESNRPYKGDNACFREDHSLVSAKAAFQEARDIMDIENALRMVGVVTGGQKNYTVKSIMDAIMKYFQAVAEHGINSPEALDMKMRITNGGSLGIRNAAERIASESINKIRSEILQESITTNLQRLYQGIKEVVRCATVKDLRAFDRKGSFPELLVPSNAILEVDSSSGEILSAMREGGSSKPIHQGGDLVIFDMQQGQEVPFTEYKITLDNNCRISRFDLSDKKTWIISKRAQSVLQETVDQWNNRRKNESQ